MASYTNGFNTFGGNMAGFLQASASNGHHPNGTGQFGGNTNRNGQGRVNCNQNSPRGNRRRGGNAGGQRPNQQPRRSPNPPNPNGANIRKGGNNPRRQGNLPNNRQARQNGAPRHPGNNNNHNNHNNHNNRNNNQRRAQQLHAAFTRTRDGDVVMRDAFVAPITALAEEDRDVVMTDAPSLPGTRAEYLTQGALAMNWFATAMLNLAVNDEAPGNTTTGSHVPSDLSVSPISLHSLIHSSIPILITCFFLVKNLLMTANELLAAPEQTTSTLLSIAYAGLYALIVPPEYLQPNRVLCYIRNPCSPTIRGLNLINSILMSDPARKNDLFASYPTPTSFTMSRLESLPDELLLLIASFATTQSTIAALARTSHRLYSIYEPCLYRWNVVHDQSSALDWAAEHGNMITFQKALDAGAPLPVEYSSEELTSRPKKLHDFEPHPLTLAARAGHEAIVRFIIEKGASPDMIDPERLTLLSVAAIHGHVSLTRTLLALAGLNFFHGCGQTPLSTAAKNGDTDILLLLLKHGADPNKVLNLRLTHAALTEAVIHKQKEAALILVQHTQRLHCTRVLSFAVQHDDKQMFESLLKEGVAPEFSLSDLAGHSVKDDVTHVCVQPIVYAVQSQDIRLVEMLLDRGADVNVKCLRWPKGLYNAVYSHVLFCPVEEQHEKMVDFYLSAAQTPTLLIRSINLR
ncbi:hypothetical protein CNMCM6106_001970 [Aspergillus hiratsukae]|uniref:Ankyrin repeat-containing domain protein n=1 Tax=Aspergillus hiratsukae TaxID=1194566 RepID=A0A8H6Q5F7_9EURO|nr:hypothetical protein CNMCM6106_001970 [Aspergillus hiratsukae]